MDGIARKPKVAVILEETGLSGRKARRNLNMQPRSAFDEIATAQIMNKNNQLSGNMSGVPKDLP